MDQLQQLPLIVRDLRRRDDVRLPETLLNEEGMEYGRKVDYGSLPYAQSLFVGPSA